MVCLVAVLLVLAIALRKAAYADLGKRAALETVGSAAIQYYRYCDEEPVHVDQLLQAGFLFDWDRFCDSVPPRGMAPQGLVRQVDINFDAERLKIAVHGLMNQFEHDECECKEDCVFVMLEGVPMDQASDVCCQLLVEYWDVFISDRDERRSLP